MKGKLDIGKLKAILKDKQLSDTVFVNNPNDPRLKAYQDSSRLHQSFIDTKTNLQKQGYKKHIKGNMNYNDVVNKAFRYKKLFDTKQETEDLANVSDLVPWVINPSLGRQLISKKIKPTSVEQYVKEADKPSDMNKMLKWVSYDNKSNNHRFTDEGEYIRVNSKDDKKNKSSFANFLSNIIGTKEFTSDQRAIADYSNVKPKQTVILNPPTKTSSKEKSNNVKNKPKKQPLPENYNTKQQDTIIKTEEPRPVEKKFNIYEGYPVYSPGIGSGLPRALIGFMSKSGDTVMIKPEDYERFAVPKYAQAYIESKKQKQ